MVRPFLYPAVSRRLPSQLLRKKGRGFKETRFKYRLTLIFQFRFSGSVKKLPAIGERRALNAVALPD
jgi:hypothetical protein